MTDRELLADYAQTGSGNAFEEIVRRHSGMVLQACRRVLGDEHGAEDAAQATFLLLTRKARKLSAKTVLSGWLFRAAQNSAMHLRREHARRSRREKEAAIMREGGEAPSRELWADIEPQITVAIAALPTRQRDAVVLRYVAGKAPGEAAREMGCSENSFSVSLSKAMAKLRGRFAMKGTALPAGALASMLLANAPAAAPEALTASIAAACLGTAEASASASAVAIANGVSSAMAWAKLKIAAICLAAAGAAAAAGGAAVHAIAQPAVEDAWIDPDFTPNPAVTRILASLGPGESASLPVITAAGELNRVARKYALDRTGPCGRNYGIKMVWMPDRRRAIFTGANHRVPHRLNDVWEYDLPSNSWVCLYGPDDLGTAAGWEDVKLVDGVLRTSRGGPAIIGNGEWQTCYAPGIRAMVFHSPWSIHSKEIRDRLTGKSRHRPPIWHFHPESRKWKPVHITGDRPGGTHAVYLDYLDAPGRVAWVNGGYLGTGMWYYDPASRRFEKLVSGESFKPRNNPNVPPGSGVSAYCPGRNLLVVATGGKTAGSTHHFDVESRKWTRTAHGPEVPKGHMSFTPCGYDTTAGVMLLYDQGNKLFSAYDPERKQWSTVKPKGPPPPSGGAKVFGYYDPERNVFVLCQNQKVWVYRHLRR